MRHNKNLEILNFCIKISEHKSNDSKVANAEVMHNLQSAHVQICSPLVLVINIIVIQVLSGPFYMLSAVQEVGISKHYPQLMKHKSHPAPSCDP